MLKIVLGFVVGLCAGAWFTTYTFGDYRLIHHMIGDKIYCEAMDMYSGKVIIDWLPDSIGRCSHRDFIQQRLLHLNLGDP